jgi:hypothetical protein
MAETDAKKAAEILALDRKPGRAEQAALDCVDKQRWVLWHADDYAAAVVRLLSHAGRLRDRDRESELKDADRVMRRLDDEASAKLKRELSAALAEVDRLRAAESPAPGRTDATTETENR